MAGTLLTVEALQVALDKQTDDLACAVQQQLETWKALQLIASMQTKLESLLELLDKK